jgi:rhamnogalacturonyl hydrolase YesR
MNTLLKSVALSIALFTQSALADSSSLDAEQVSQTLHKTATWHLENPVDRVTLRWWHIAPYYDGLIALSKATGDPTYLAHVIDYGERSGWSLGHRTYFADDQAVGHAWLDVYAMDPSKSERLEETKKLMDFVVDNPIQEDLRIGAERPTPKYVLDRWTWCDALYMGPPTLLKLSNITGDQKYLRFMDYEYRVTYDELWDPQEKLFYRDSRFITQRTDNGEKIFWSRGNGWVYGGLAIILEELPQDDLSRPFYEKVFIEMTQGVLRTQQPDGLWRPSLNDPEHVTEGESSGTSFFLYGLAWGINNGYLDKEAHWPRVVKGWNALMTRIQPSGMLGYVQPVGADPRNNIRADYTQVFGAGAFFLAGSEILVALDAESDVSSEELYQKAQAMQSNGSFDRSIGAYVIPSRKFDLAWENDKVAFRVYGPDLKDSAEDSGVDVWSKRVNTPVVQKWYREEREDGKSYHVDHGEGLDAYKVGAARGCGGTGIWYNGKLYTSNVYVAGYVMNTGPEVARMVFEYVYDIDGKTVKEEKMIELEEGSYLCRAQSRFSGDTEILDDMKVAIGLTPQTDSAEIESKANVLSMWDEVGGSPLGTAVAPIKDYDTDSIEIILPTEDQPDALILCRATGTKKTWWGESQPTLWYAFGYGWEPQTGMDNHSQWKKYLKQTLREN